MWSQTADERETPKIANESRVRVGETSSNVPREHDKHANQETRTTKNTKPVLTKGIYHFSPLFSFFVFGVFSLSMYSSMWFVGVRMSLSFLQLVTVHVSPYPLGVGPLHAPVASNTMARHCIVYSRLQHYDVQQQCVCFSH